MALKTMVLTCDHCYYESDEFNDPTLAREDYLSEAQELGWYIVLGPQRDLGADGERVYCSKDCLDADL